MIPMAAPKNNPRFGLFLRNKMQPTNPNAVT